MAMDPSSLLDHALFLLTPTRTRCDLFAVPHPSVGGPREKIASGLVEPFLAHLRSTRELLPKGGYSFSLRPSTFPSPWFTKATLERFVRFVATPEILERVVIIENEIIQIDDSIRKEDLSVANGAAKKPAAATSKASEDLGKEDEVQEENSKICLVRVLENRKMMLLKEQGMAYARASVAGFEKGNIDNLISFADAFGADRLRDACINFKELCKEKEQDKLWMDELAALEASRAAHLSYLGASGVTLTSEVNAESQQHQNGADDSVRAQIANGAGSMPWNSGPYMYSFQNPGLPGSAPFPGYAFPFPGIQMIPPYPGYAENFHWSHRGDEKDVDGSRSHGMSEKLHRSAETTRSSRDAYSDNDSSNSESEPDEHHVSTDADSSRKSHRQKKSKKKSSRTVVIRNINYISKGRHGEDEDSIKSSGEDDLIDGDSLRRQVEDIVGSFGKHQNSSRHHGKNKGDRRKSGSANVCTENDDKVMEDDTSPNKSKEKTGGGWDAFQNILMRDESHSDELDKGIKDAHVEGSTLQQVDIASEYCTIKNDKIMPSSTARYQPHNELEKGTKPKILTTDPLIETAMGANSAGNGSLGNFESIETNGRIIKRTHGGGDDLLVSERMKSEMNTHEVLSNFDDESSTYRGRRDGDWFPVSGSEGQFAREGSRGRMIFDGEKFVRTENNIVHKERTRSDITVDDSFIAPVRDVVIEEQSSSLWGTDINMISGAAASGPNSKASDKSKETRKPEFYEPEELQLVFERHTEVEDIHASWNPEIEFKADVTHAIIEEKKPVIEAEATNPSEEKTPPNTKSTKAKSQIPPKTSLLSRSATKNKLEALSRPKTISTVNQKGTNMSKSAKEEAERKRIEELRIQREKRIAQRSASMGSSAASKPSSTERRTSLGKSPASQPAKQHGFGYAAKFSAEKVTAK